MTIGLAIFVILLSFYIMAEIVDKRFVQSLDNISHWLKLSPDIAGATLLAIGTSAPEISTALVALFLAGASPATGVGTIVGSAIFNLVLVVGFASAISTCYLNWRSVLRDVIAYAISVLLLYWFAMDDKFTFNEAGIFMLTYVAYIIFLLYWSKMVKNGSDAYERLEKIEEEMAKHPEKSKNIIVLIFRAITFPITFIIDSVPDPKKKESWTIPVFILSLAVIAYSSYWLVEAAEDLAAILQIPPAIIALTILAGGTSVPELISSAIVARQGHGDMAVSNAIGSNTFDILMGLGLPVMLYILMKGGAVEGIGGKDIAASIVLLFGSLIFIVLFLTILKFKANRFFGFTLIIIYVLYVYSAYAGWISA